MKSIVNRRENLRVNELPPEIPDTSTFAKKTDKATASKLGLVKIGENVNVTSGGVISVSDASSETKGVMKLGTGLSVNADTGAVDVSVTGGVTVDLLCAETTEDNQGKELTPTNPISGYKAIVIVIKHGDGNTCSTFLVDALVVNDSTAKNAAPVMGTSNTVIPLRFKYTTEGKIVTDPISNIWHTATLYGIK